MTSTTAAPASPAQATFTLHGKTAIVTGAGSGINLSFAELLLEAGTNVVFADLSLRPEAQKVVDRFVADQDGKPRAVFVKTDVTHWDQLETMFKVADEEFGGADIVCPGAGIFEPPWSNFWNPPGTVEAKDSHTGEPNGLGHYTTLDLNLTHPIRVTQMAMARWLNPQPGSRVGKVSPQNPKRVVHITSVAGQLASLLSPLYHASKHGLSGFIKSLAGLDQLGIRVNGVAPGLIMTPLWSDHADKMKFANAGHQTWVLPKEVAEAMVACLVDDQYGAGAIVEVTRDKRRMVELLNDPGPDPKAVEGFEGGRAFEEALGKVTAEGWGTDRQAKS
ncbi:Carbonyl reductase family member 4 [Sphaceloma murrayae]|uniref:Carbonyl reductase family member 4 n=1 Tax=Sphaceloma murrayae TaxID=2082308 RepID=A0A2K1QVR3_9PEZI|nr:Carbonyl reductase family member 4 [Sphaceloma murrayae]